MATVGRLRERVPQLGDVDVFVEGQHTKGAALEARQWLTFTRRIAEPKQEEHKT